MKPLPSAIGSTWLPGGARPCWTSCGIGGQVDELELEPRGLADQLLQRFGILDPRHLDEDAVAALGDDGDFLGARRDRCGGGRRRGRRPSRPSAPAPCRSASASGRSRVESTTWTSQSRLPVSATGWVRLRIRSTAASTCVGLRTRKDRRPPAVEMSPMSMRGSRRSSVATESSIACSRCFSASRCIGLEQQVAAAGKVEAEADLVLRQPLRPAAGVAAFRRSGSGSTAGRRPRRRG